MLDWMHKSGGIIIKWLQVPLPVFALLMALAPGCGEETATVETTETTVTRTSVPYKRQQIDIYLGITEPRCEDLADMVRESFRLQDDNFNTVGILPPVLTTQRAGGQPRVILEAAAASADESIGDFHKAGMAVFLAPTTSSPGFETAVDPQETTLEHLKEDVLRWAETAEEKQVELFSPLSQYNLALGTKSADRWSEEVLPEIRKVYSGDIAAKVIPDLDGQPLGGSHDFEELDYRGYDYLMLDIFPTGDELDDNAFKQYVTEILGRGAQVARRDGLKGVMVGEFGGWQEQTGVSDMEGPALGAEGQAYVAQIVLDAAMPNFSGAFFQGWTLPGRGARDFPVEETLKKYYGSSMVAPPAAANP